MNRGGEWMKEINEINEITDRATGQMLTNLIEKKKKFDQLKKQHHFALWVTAVGCTIFLYYLTHTVIGPHAYSAASMITAFVSKSLHLYAFLAVAGMAGATKIFYQRKEKAEKEFHALRCEIIDRSKDLWKEEAWMNRHIVFETMKKQYDINLFHEAK
ncbi:hypothetical protein AV649_05505 [Rossellomorea marisflavi]|uniref:Uncharacterized protein n=2 Tax=Bacillaceae TaxID=186817 RepID=A0A165J8I1_9BACI|nr:hypothetical protein AV649_05505 [Rossellomorea marisflavi]TYO72958.1 DUF2663 family protein [Rossellomorea marisflavi]